MMQVKRKLLFVMLLFLCSASNLALSDSVTFVFTGHVWNVSPELSSSFQVNDSFSGYYTFDSTTDPFTHISDGSDFSFYDSALIEASVNIHGYTFGIDPLGYVNGIYVGDNYPTENWQHYRVEGALTGSSFGNYEPKWTMLVNLVDKTSIALNSNDLLLVPPNLSDYEGTSFHFSLGFYDELNNDWANVNGSLSSLTLKTVPIPAAAWLFCSGLLGLFAVIKRNKIQA